MDQLTRTTSIDSTQSQTSHHLLSTSRSRSPSISRKGKQAELDTSSIDVDRAHLSMPPPLKPVSRYQKFTRRLSSRENYALPRQTAVHSPSQDDKMPNEEEESMADATKREASGVRASAPDLEMNRMSFSSLYNYGRGQSGPSSLGGGSDQDGGQLFDVTETSTDANALTAKYEPGDRATTATQPLSVTTSSRDGALSPSLTGSLRDTVVSPAQSVMSSSPGAAPAVPDPGKPRPGRTVRGRTLAASGRLSMSGAISASPSADRSSTGNPNRIGTIGICALDSKARSKPSRNILNRLVGKDAEFDVIIFGDKVILDEAVEDWPLCDFFISFFSDGFPLEKAIAYAKLRKPFCVNDLPMQTILWDRRLCLKILDKVGVPTPKRLEVNRDGGPVILTSDIAQRVSELAGVQLVGSEDGRGGASPPPTDVHMEDDDDTLVVDGERLSKPFVEKPVSSEDHNINIYYPRSQGGGGRRLFRKVNNKSSEKDDSLVIPNAITEGEGSYIYEQFLKVENAEDVKAYTVGHDFCHAETRKSPVVDGLVKRNPNGKEIRYVTQLTEKEQEMASRVAMGFGQRICGFDLLRVEDKSYVIDVNGWSFVKDNNHYYDQCARILRDIFIREKMRWEAAGQTNPGDISEDGGKDLMLPPPIPGAAVVVNTDSLENISHIGASRKNAAHSTGREKDPSGSQSAAPHRNALRTVLRSHSISQLRDSVSHIASRVGHPTISGTSPGGTPSSGLSSPPSIERSHGTIRGSRTVPNVTNLGGHEIPALPAGHGAFSQLRDGRSASDDHLVQQNVSSGRPSDAVSTHQSLVPAPASKSQWKLKGMVAVIRHADRTPKQKFKFTFHTKPFVDLLKGHHEEVLLVGEAALDSVAEAVEQAIEEGLEDQAKLRTLRNALSRKRSLPGTKVQIKPMFKKPKDKNKDKEGKKKEKDTDGVPAEQAAAASSIAVESPAVEKQETLIDDASESSRVQQRSDSVSEITMSRAAAADNNLVLDKLQLVMKWGGEPTHSARYQAADLGENMRNDLLLMNRDALNDVSIFTSSERRVTTSAQIFASAFLDEKEVDDSQIHVRKDLLDDSNAAKDEMDKVKKKLKGLLRKGYEAPAEQFAWPKDGTPEPYVVVRQVVELMRFHRKVMRSNFAKLGTSDAVTALEKLRGPVEVEAGNEPVNNVAAQQASTIQARWCTGEDAELFKERWEKLFDEFIDAEKVDPSKISELYDSMKFDALHNRQFLEWVFTPSKALLAEEEKRRQLEEGYVDSAEGEELARTESQTARDEWKNTHVFQEPTNPEAIDSNISSPPPPRRTNTSASETSLRSIRSESKRNDASKEPSKERITLSQRMGFRGRSQDFKTVVREPYAGDAQAQSYFNLYRGDSNTSSKAKHDVQLEKLTEMYTLTKILFDFIGPQEYGITNAEKLEIGLLTSLPLLKEIVRDLEEVQASDEAKSFIYYTKERSVYAVVTRYRNTRLTNTTAIFIPC